MTQKNLVEIYNNDEYANNHKEWHLEDTEDKVKDLSLFCNSLASQFDQETVRIADVGSGFGGVLDGFGQQLYQASGKKFKGTAFEISEYAVSKGKQLFNSLEWINRPLVETDGPFDLIMFVDVLEHVENPWELLRLASRVSKYMLIRQPLLDNFSNFRTDNYKHHREHWGHIAFYNYRSFLDMANASGWAQHDTKLLAPWELNTNEKLMAVPLWKKIALKKSRINLSYLISGFYLNGLFKSTAFSDI